MRSIKFLIFLALLMTLKMVRAKADDYDVIIQQLKPLGIARNIVCKDIYSRCDAFIKVNSLEGEKNILVNIQKSQAYLTFQFTYKEDKLYIAGQPYLRIPIGFPQTSQKIVVFLSPQFLSNDQEDSIFQHPVIRQSGEALAELEISIIPDK